MSLAMDEGESEQNEMRNLQEKLESTTRLVYTLSQQLNELKEQVRRHFSAIFVAGGIIMPGGLFRPLLIQVGCIAGARVSSWISKGPGDNVTVVGLPEFWLSLSAKQHRNPCFRPPSVNQDLSMRNDWSVEKAIVDLPIRLKENSKRISGNEKAIVILPIRLKENSNVFPVIR